MRDFKFDMPKIMIEALGKKQAAFRSTIKAERRLVDEFQFAGNVVTERSGDIYGTEVTRVIDVDLNIIRTTHVKGCHGQKELQVNSQTQVGPENAGAKKLLSFYRRTFKQFGL